MIASRFIRFATSLLLALAFSGTAVADALYGMRVVVPAPLRPEADAAAKDLVATLARMTGKPFEASKDLADQAIVLRRVGDADVPAAAAKAVPDSGPESFAVWPEGDKRLWLVGRADLGLAHAVYAYLDHLGCRWYFPTDRWTIIPDRQDVRIDRVVAQAPAFRSRFFAGTGGFGRGLPVDPKGELQPRWQAWQRRNRFGGEFLISGHSGEAFNLKHKKILEEHPEYRAMVDGKRVPYSAISKFCPANEEVVSLYIKDRLDAYRLARKLDPGGPRAWAVSVEPADGGGHCDSPEARAIGSVSDRVFHIANRVARAVKAEYPDGHVSLLAYNEHAAVPKIDIDPNVYVVVTPYAFQRTGLTPDQLLDAWSKKLPRMGVYDYWSIPDWTHDLPTFDFLGFGPDRLRGWHARHIDGFLCESTYSSGAMGPAWLIAGLLAWDPKASEQAIFDDFLKTCFGPAETPIRRMLTRWADGYRATSHEFALSYRELDEAYRLADGKPEVLARIADYGRYVEYLRLRFEYLRAGPKSPAAKEQARALFRHMWGIYHSTMIHAFRHSQLLGRDYADLDKEFDWRDPKAAGWETVKAVTDDDVRQAVARGAKAFTPLEFTARKFTGKLAPVDEGGLGSGEYSQPIWLSNSVSFKVLVKDGTAPKPVRIASEKPARATVRDAAGNTVAESIIETGEKWGEEWSELKLPTTPGLYSVEVVSQKRPLRLSVADDVHLSLDGWYNSQGRPTPPLYFLAPKEVARLALFTEYTAAGPPRFFDPDGKEVKPVMDDGGKILLLDVPERHRGKVWSLDRAKCPLGSFDMLNAPPHFSLHRGALLAPAGAR